MEPFFFGKQREMFGAFHPAQGLPREHGVLIAAPLLNEGIRAHFVLRQIAERCASSGYDVLRFDYSCLGNSPGDSANASLEDWSQDIITAADELLAVCGSSPRTVVAGRFAANLVSELVDSGCIERLILWDPILSGEHWLANLYEHQSNLREAFRRKLAEPDREFSGHRTHENFVADLKARAIVSYDAPVIAAVISQHYCHLDALERITGDIDQVEFDCGWQKKKSAILYPADIVESLCDRLI